jgi:hypothetical protein
VTFGNLTLAAPAGSDADQVCVGKFSAQGSPIWLRAITGTGVLAGRGIGTDGLGRVIIAGEFTGRADFDAGGGAVSSLTAAGGNDCFVGVFDTSGTLQWLRGFGGGSNDKCRGTGGDATGNVYIAGAFGGSVSFGTQAATAVGASNLFLTKLDPVGSTVWLRTLGSNGTDEGSEIEVANDGSVVLAGEFGGSATLPWGQQVLASAGAREMFTVRYSSDGEVEWFSTSLGSGDDVNYALSLGADETVTLVGTFAGRSGGTIRFGAIMLDATVGPSSFVASSDGVRIPCRCRRLVPASMSPPQRTSCARSAASARWLCRTAGSCTRPI